MQVMMLLLAVLLSGCYEERAALRRDAYVRPDYTRAEIDAINAEIACRNLARNLLQIERCGVRR